jgi:hypothetical protein
MADVPLNSRQLAALADAAAAAIDEAQQRGRLTRQARFAVRLAGERPAPTLQVVLEDVRELMVANGYRVAWTCLHPGIDLIKAPGRCRPRLTPEADTALDAAYEIVAPYAAGLLRVEAVVDETLLRRQTEALAERFCERFSPGWSTAPRLKA